MAQDVQQQSLEGEVVGVQATVARRTRPSILIQTEHFRIKSNARTLEKARAGGEPKLMQKVRVRKDKVRGVSDLTDKQEEKEITALLEAAMHYNLPGYDDDWVVLQKGAVEVE